MSKNLFYLILLGCLLLLGSCNFYRHASLTKAQLGTISEPETFWSSMNNGRPMLFVVSRSTPYLIEKAQFGPESLQGEARKQDLVLDWNTEGSIRRASLPDQLKDIYQQTLFLYTNEPIETGRITLGYDQVTRVLLPEKNRGLSIGLTAATIVGSAVGGFAIFLAIACNCPQVYAYSETGEKINQGSMLTGAISQSLAREDRLLIHGLDRSQDRITLTVANELPEDEYLDQIKLYRIPATKPAEIAYGENGQLFQLEQLQAPLAAQSHDGHSVLKQLRSEDQEAYNFDAPALPERLSSVQLTFARTQEMNQVHLVIQARQSDWMLAMGEQFFQLLGKEYPRWQANMDEVDPAQYAQNTAERGMSLNAYVKTTQGWEWAGAFHNAGNRQAKRMALKLDLSKIEGSEVEVRLESAYRFWELDAARLSPGLSPITLGPAVPLLNAFNELGEDVRELILEKDDSHTVLPNQGSFLDLEFDNTAEKNESYVLSLQGYYHHVREQEHSADRNMLRWLKSDPITTHQWSYTLYQVQALNASIHAK